MQQSANHCFTCWERNPQTSAKVPGCSTEAEMGYFLWDLQSCSTIQIWEKFGLWDVLFSFMLNDALDSLLAAFQHFHIGVSLLNRQLSGISLQSLYILHGAILPQVVKYRLFISTLCSSGSELCVSRVKSLSETFNVKQHCEQTSPSSSYLTGDFS